jgi:hypothetical protein
MFVSGKDATSNNGDTNSHNGGMLKELLDIQIFDIDIIFSPDKYESTSWALRHRFGEAGGAHGG